MSKSFSFNHKTSINDAFHEIMFHCVEEIESNLVHITQNPEFLHQVRVNLRKLYISMQLLVKLFPAILKNKQFINFKQEIKDYESSLSVARDWDVFTDITLTHIISQLKSDANLQKIQQQANTIRLAKQLQGYKYIRTKHNLWSRFKTWLAQGEFVPNCNLSVKPVSYISDMLLHQQRKKLRSKLAIQQMSPKKQHQFRIFIKQYHYTLGFFRHFYAKGDVQKYLKNLKFIQDTMGNIHDHTVMCTLCNELVKHCPNITHDYIIAIGKIVGYNEYQINLTSTKLDKKLQKIHILKPLKLNK